jgi:hypothetical protein
MVTLSFQLPDEGPVVRASGFVRRVWCRDGTVELGLEVRRANPEALKAITRAARECAPVNECQRQREMPPPDLDALLRQVAADTFPQMAERLEAAASGTDPVQTGILFRALVRIEANKPDIAERFVTLAREELVPEMDEAGPDDRSPPHRFDQVKLVEAFATACELSADEILIRELMEEIVIAVGFRHLAPSLSAGSV